MLKYVLITLICVFTYSVNAQTIFSEVKKYDKTKIEKDAIRKTCRKNHCENLSSLIYFDVGLRYYLKEKPTSEKEFLNALSLDNYRCEVYDMLTKTIVSERLGKNNSSSVPYSSSYLEYIQNMSPDYVFYYKGVYFSDGLLFICVKNDSLTFLDVVNNKDDLAFQIKPYSFSEIKEWSWVMDPFPQIKSMFDYLSYQDTSSLPSSLRQTVNENDLFGEKVLFTTKNKGHVLYSKEKVLEKLNSQFTNNIMPSAEVILLTDDEIWQARGCKAFIGLDYNNFHKKKKKLIRICNRCK